jgi:hypothetical protein
MTLPRKRLHGPRGVGCGRTDRKEVDWALQILSGSEYVACVAVLR